jgi:hypothetical protein
MLQYKCRVDVGVELDVNTKSKGSEFKYNFFSSYIMRLFDMAVEEEQ